jgi:hypothetical protein
MTKLVISAKMDFSMTSSKDIVLNVDLDVYIVKITHIVMYANMGFSNLKLTSLLTFAKDVDLTVKTAKILICATNALKDLILKMMANAKNATKGVKNVMKLDVWFVMKGFIWIQLILNVKSAKNSVISALIKILV